MGFDSHSASPGRNSGLPHEVDQVEYQECLGDPARFQPEDLAVTQMRPAAMSGYPEEVPGKRDEIV